jgi:hypothetical protein
MQQLHQGALQSILGVLVHLVLGSLTNEAVAVGERNP